jgi:hypothetical protein
MDRTLFRTTAMVGLVLSFGVTAAHAGGHHVGTPFRPMMMRMHGGGWSHAAYNGGTAYRRMPPVSGVAPGQPGYGGQVAGGYIGNGYGPGPAVYPMRGYGQGQGYSQGQAYPGTGYGHGPAIYSTQGRGYAQGYGYAAQPAGYAVQRPGVTYVGGSGYGTGRQHVADMRLYAREGGRYGYRQGGRYGRGYGYGAAAAAGIAAGYAVAGGDYGVGYTGGSYDAGYDAPSSVTSTGYDTGYDTGYPAPETPLTVTYGEAAMQPVPTTGLFGTGGYALDGQIQDVGYGGPTVAGYGFGGAAGWSQGIAPAGGLAVYSPGAYGPGPRVITIPSQYRTGGSSSLGCTCGPARPGY